MLMATTLHYWTPARGWWTGHANLPPTNQSLEEYVRGLNTQPGYRVRIVEDDGTLIGDACAICSAPHDGLDGGCLI